MGGAVRKVEGATPLPPTFLFFSGGGGLEYILDI